MKHLINVFIYLVIISSTTEVFAQKFNLKGKVNGDSSSVVINARILELNLSTQVDSNGFFHFENVKPSTYTMRFSSLGFKTFQNKIVLSSDTTLATIYLSKQEEQLDDVVVTGTLKAVNRLESPVPVEIYNSSFFKKNPTVNLFEALQNINGIRPQLNCSICNTGDIHINGLEGPYTMVLIDGMPIVSSLSTVYGLAGIPNALVDRIEIVKGPASSLYGSEAVGGLINVITKKVGNAPSLHADVMGSSYGEYNTDLGLKTILSKKVSLLTGVNYFKYNNPVDHNHDNFTDVTLQDRISVFQKYNIERKYNRIFTLASRFMYEDRWGGEMQWNKNYRGGDEIYGESIYTKRFEILSNYQLPFKEKMMLAVSLTSHQQDSRYGDVSYIANQKIAFGQLTWDKKIKQHDLLFGIASRFTYYDDNTPATYNYLNQGFNQAEKVFLPGIFAQDEIKFSKNHSVLLGFRYDYNSKHGSIYTPRFAYKYQINDQNILRLNAGTGYRVVNLFTEDHAALTGARKVVIQDKLKPEKSYNLNLNYLNKMFSSNGTIITTEASVFYTYFNNRIIADYMSNPNEINYGNLNGFAVSKGLGLNVDASFPFGLKALLGATLQDISFVEDNIPSKQMLTERISANWALSYPIQLLKLELHYTGNLYGPMQLPLLGALDPRSEYSPTWSIQNIQFVFKGFNNFDIYGGVKNLLNFTPNRNNPFIIARANDPFDRNVQFDGGGNAIASPSNPYALTFDPTYIYAPNQGIRGFLGVRYTLK